MNRKRMESNAVKAFGNLIGSYYFYLFLILAGMMLSVSSTSPSPSASIEPLLDVTPSPNPSPSASPTTDPSPSAQPLLVISPSPTPSPSPSPSVEPSPTPSVEPSPSASPSPSIQPSPSTSPSPSIEPSPSIPACEPSEEVCDGVDNDCDDLVDEDDFGGPLAQACGAGQCASTSVCVDGQYGQCNSAGDACEICGTCSSEGICSFDDSRNDDCSIYNVDEIGTCAYVPDGIDVTRDTSDGFTSQCIGLNECSQFDPNTIDHACDLSCGAECTPQDISACTPRIVDDLCLTDSSCGNSCSCEYDSSEYCPTPGTVTDNVCYYGEQTCDGEVGCGLDTSTMQCDSFFDVFYEVCDPTLGPQDISGPVVTMVDAHPDPTNQWLYVNATIEDMCTLIMDGEYYFDECGAPGTGTPIYPSDDGSYDGDKNTEYVGTGAIDLSAIPDGRHSVFVRGKNSQGYWGECNFDTFEVDKIAPDFPRNVEVPYWVCADDADISALMCDSQSHIDMSEYFVDEYNLPNGLGYPMYVGPDFMWNNLFCSYVNGTIINLDFDEGLHGIKLHSKDEAGNWGKFNAGDPFWFLIDRTPPTTEKTISEPKIECDYFGEQREAGECWYVTQDTWIALNATDYVPEDGHFSNQEQIYYRIRFKQDFGDEWGAWTAWILYTGPFRFQEDSIHEIEYYGIDFCSNEEEHHFEIDIVDTTPPVTEKVVGDPKVACDEGEDCDYYITQQTPIEFICEDQQPHPVDDVSVYFRYKINDGEFEQWMEYNGEPFFFEEDSRHTLEYYCVDALGNEERIHTEIDVVDTQAPELFKEVGEPKHACEQEEECHYFLNQSTEITLTCIDTEPHPVGGETIYYNYCVDTGDDEYCVETMEYVGPFAFPEDSWHTLSYWCSDELGNTVRGEPENDIVDSQPPITTKFVSEPKVPCSELDDDTCDYYITQDTEISFSCTDPEPHPVDHQQVYYRYKINDGAFSEWVLYGEPFSFDEDSRHTLEYYCVDALGNKEETQTEVDVVDSQPPVTNKTVGDPKHECEVEDECDWFITQQTHIALECADPEPHPVNLVDIYYKYCVQQIDDPFCTEWMLYEGPFAFPEDSRHTLEYYCVDALGNEEEHQFEEDLVDTQPPLLTKEIGEPKFVEEVVCGDGPNGLEPNGAVVVPPVGTEIHTITFPEGPETGVGVAFDGEFLYYTYIYDSNIYKIRPDGTGHAVIPTTGLSETGWGALSFDAGRGMLWAGTYGCDEGGNGPVYLIDPDTGVATYQFSVPSTYIVFCLDDGIAYDATDDSIWYSDDVQPTMVHMASDGTFLGTVDLCSIHSDLCTNSGIAIGGDNFYLGTDGRETTLRVDRDTLGILDTFVNTDFRIEDMECDPDTYGPTEVMWIRDAYSGQARAYAIEPQTCGLGGKPPEPTCTNNTYITSNTTISLWCEDLRPHPSDHVQINYRYRYQFDFNYSWGNWSDWVIVDGEHTEFTFNEDSIHELEYYCVDILGNVDEHQFETDIVDNQGPIVEKFVGEPKHACEEGEECDWYITQDTPIDLRCTDLDPHPVDRNTIYYRYKINDGEFEQWMEYGETIYFEEDSIHTLEYYCEDALGNVGPLYSEVDVVDTEPPETTKTIGDPKVLCSDIGAECDYYVTQQTPIALECADPEPHPVDHEEIYYWYCVEGDEGEWCTDEILYTEPFTFGEDSWHTLYYYCVDALGNEEELQTELDIVDTQPPEVEKEVSDPAIECDELGRDDCHYFVTQETEITLYCEDPEPHPVNDVALFFRWRLDGGNWTEWIEDGEEVTIQFEEDSVHEIEYYCEDLLGNTAGPYVEIDRVDTTPPNTTKYLMDDPAYEGTHTECVEGDECDYYMCKGDSIGFSSQDGGPICHVDGETTYYRYRINGNEWYPWTEYNGENNFTFHPAQSEGIYEFEYYGIDQLGNEEEHQFEIDWYDKHKPKAWVLNPTSGRWYHDGEQFSVYAPAFDRGDPSSGFDSCEFYAMDIHFEDLDEEELPLVIWYTRNPNTFDDLLDILDGRYTMVSLGSIPYENGICKGVAQIPEDSGLTDKAYLAIKISDRSCNMYFDLARDSAGDEILMDIDNTPPAIELTGTEGLDEPMSTGDYFASWLRAIDYDSALFQCFGEIVQNACVVEDEIGDPIITPFSVEAWLNPGESIHEEKSITTESTPITAVDVFFQIDLTGSMGGELSQVKTSSIDIMDDVRLLVADSQFGVSSFMDYPHFYGSEGNCGYSSWYGDSEEGDYAYSLDQDITSDTTSVSNAINGLSLGDGMDGPEAYSRALYEAQWTSWRPEAKRIAVMFGDNIPHDCGFNGASTGKDPGRDEIVGTGDDLDFEDVVANLSSKKISVIAVDSGSQPAPWQYMADQTGGQYFELDAAEDIPEAIVALIWEETSMIDEVTVEVEPGYEAWVDWEPFSYTNVTGNQTLDFEFWFEVPLGTEPGEYTFWVRILGDGSLLREQVITIHVPGECDESEEEHFNFAGHVLTDETCKIFGNVPEGLEDGSHTLVLYAQDFEYNTDSVTTTMMVDNSPPMKEVIAPLAGETYGEIIPIEIVALDLTGVNQDTVQYRVFEDIASLFGVPIGEEKYDSGWRTLPLVEGDSLDGTYFEEFNATLEGLEHGKTYYLRARACDYLFEGELPSGAEIPEHCTDPEIIFELDLMGPSAPANVVISDGKLTWSASTDDNGVAYYKIYLDGEYYGGAASTSFQTAGDAGTWAVSAVDTLGNEGEKAVAQAPSPPDNNTPGPGSSSSNYVPPSSIRQSPEEDATPTPSTEPVKEETKDANQIQIEPEEEDIPVVSQQAKTDVETPIATTLVVETTSPTTGLVVGNLLPYLGGAMLAIALLFLILGKRRKKKKGLYY